MAYDELLGERISRALAGRRGVIAKKMFGGICFMVNGHMCCGIIKDDLMIRLEPDQAVSLLKKPGVRPMDFSGRPMDGFLYVAPSATKTEKALHAWVDLAAAYALSRPAKAAKAAKKNPVKPNPAKKRRAPKT